MEDSQSFCPTCGTPVNGAPAAATVINSTDHTAEFDPKDISENKVVAMLPYLASYIGIIVAAIIAKDSPYVAFHIRQALKLAVCEIICCIMFVIPILGWIAGGICLAIIGILGIIAFFQVCGGKAKEPAIISNLKFLK
jgi:uncharacterized membrane protein